MKITRRHHTPSETVRYLVAAIMVVNACVLFASPAAAEEVFGESVRIQTADPVLFFDDNAGGRDWSLFSSSLAAEYFGLADVSAMTIPFRVDGDLPTNALRVTKDSSGAVNVGIGGIPSNLMNLHIRSELSPRIRLEKQGADSWVWDIAGNHGSFFVHDITSGEVPFAIETGAPTHVLYVTESGRVGLGTTAPDANSRLEIRSSLTNALMAKRLDANAHFLRVENSISAFRCGVQGNGDAQFGALTADRGLNLLAGGTSKVAINAAGQINFGNPPPPFTTDVLRHQTGARLTSGGVWTNASSRALKQDIEPITSEQARDTVRALQPVGYHYKNELDERYVGFIAEDVPELVATNDRKGLATMDIVGVLTKVVQDQDQQLDQQRQELGKQRQLVAQQQETLAAQQAALVAVTKRLADIEQGILGSSVQAR
ncbi:MAG: tail fiber domain-containing protein [Planctomycetota bacterium]